MRYSLESHSESEFYYPEDLNTKNLNKTKTINKQEKFVSEIQEFIDLQWPENTQKNCLGHKPLETISTQLEKKEILKHYLQTT